MLARTAATCSRRGHPASSGICCSATHLRALPEERDAYARLKQSLAEKFGNERLAYAEAKTPFCERIDRLARAAAQPHG